MKLYQEAERYIKDVYFKDTHDARSNIKISEIVDAKLIADNKAKDPEYYNHRLGVVHSSSLYGCLRGVIHSVIGSPKCKEPDARKLGVFMAGNLFEDYVIDSLGSMVVEKQREYNYKHKSITLVGRSDYRIDDNGIMRIGENKSVHSDSFWHRHRSGELVAYHNQIQLQIYMWLERVLHGNEWEGVFSYISKDDCTVESAPVKYNPNIINEIVIPALDIVNEGYEKVLASGLLEKRDAIWKVIPEGTNPMDNEAFAQVQREINAIVNSVAPAPDLVVFNDNKKQWQKNWLCTYNDYDAHCYGAGWLLEAADKVARLNKEYKANMKT